MDHYTTEISGSATDGFTVTNTYLPDLTIHKISARTDKSLPGAQFVLYTDAAGERLYYDNGAWTALGGGEPADFAQTSDTNGKIIFTCIPDGAIV